MPSRLYHLARPNCIRVETGPRGWCWRTEFHYRNGVKPGADADIRLHAFSRSESCNITMNRLKWTDSCQTNSTYPEAGKARGPREDGETHISVHGRSWSHHTTLTREDFDRAFDKSTSEFQPFLSSSSTREPWESGTMGIECASVGLGDMFWPS
jgi:hypothetical protein